MSLKGDKYETTEEVRFRLEGSVVVYDGDLVYITRVTMPEEVEEKKEIARVFFEPLPYGGNRGKEVRKYLSSRKFDLTPFRMGYMNYKGRAIYLSRSPVRQNRQGLSNNNLSILEINGKRAGDVNFGRLIAEQGFVDMFKGKYPDFKTAGELLGDKDVSSVAISNTFAFVIDHDLDALILNHKGVKCGLAMKGDRGLRVSQKYHFLRQEMEEHRIPIV